MTIIRSQILLALEGHHNAVPTIDATADATIDEIEADIADVNVTELVRYSLDEAIEQ